mmetsp:Transcript_17746/g.19790  ORF Transcript_17746/g.19790 Transcript_17746/m.19790 type:complete len:83 (-) Transcript_17746:47-295(-)
MNREDPSGGLGGLSKIISSKDCRSFLGRFLMLLRLLRPLAFGDENMGREVVTESPKAEGKVRCRILLCTLLRNRTVSSKCRV